MCNPFGDSTPVGGDGGSEAGSLPFELAVDLYMFVKNTVLIVLPLVDTNRGELGRREDGRGVEDLVRL